MIITTEDLTHKIATITKLSEMYDNVNWKMTWIIVKLLGIAAAVFFTTVLTSFIAVVIVFYATKIKPSFTRDDILDGLNKLEEENARMDPRNRAAERRKERQEQIQAERIAEGLPPIEKAPTVIIDKDEQKRKDEIAKEEYEFRKREDKRYRKRYKYKK